MQMFYIMGYEAAKKDILSKRDVHNQTLCPYKTNNARNAWYQGYNCYVDNIHKRISSNVE